MISTSQIIQRLRQFVTEPGEELGRVQRVARYWLRLSWHCSRQLVKHRASQMAAALTYRTVFSLFPMLVLALVVLQGFRGAEHQQRFKETLLNLIPQRLLAASIPGEVSAAATDTETVGAELGQFISNVIDELGHVNVRGIGTVGILILVYAATALLATVERSFNTVYGVERARPWYLRLTYYYTVITLGPLVLLAGQYLQQKAFSTLTEGHWTNWLTGSLVVLSPVLTTWLVLVTMFVLLPATRVGKRAALMGSFVAALLWVFSKELFAVYVSRTGVTSLYGALGLVPLFLLWLYVTWLIVLFGLEVTCTLQAMGSREPDQDLPSSQRRLTGDPQWLIPILVRVGVAFEQGQAVDDRTLADELRLPAAAVTKLIERLEAEGLVHHVQEQAGRDSGYALAKPPDRIALADVLTLMQSMTLGDGSRADQQAWAYVRELAEVQRSAAGQTTLAQLVASDRGQTR